MFREEYQAVVKAAKGKMNLLNNNPKAYFMLCMIAGFYIAFGGFVTFTIGAYLNAAGSPFTKAVMAFSFSSALSLVVMAGAELFTGNNFVLAAGSFAGEVKWKDTARLWVICYMGNWVASILAAFMFHLTGIPTGVVGEYFATIAAAKMGGTPLALFIKGILCNIMVCLAVWCCTKMKSESGKLIMIFWCIYIFMISGFEHSIANMTVLTVGVLDPNGVAGVSIAGYLHNLLWVTPGNIIGGALFVAWPYYIVQKEK